MTDREKQIEAAAKKSVSWNDNAQTLFAMGARWADLNPDKAESLCPQCKDEYKRGAMELDMCFGCLINSAHQIQAKLAIAVEALGQASKKLDNIKYDLETSVYTLTDEEFETVFWVRDECDRALEKIK